MNEMPYGNESSHPHLPKHEIYLVLLFQHLHCNFSATFPISSIEFNTDKNQLTDSPEVLNAGEVTIFRSMKKH